MDNISNIMREKVKTIVNHRRDVITDIQTYDNAYQKARVELIATDSALKELEDICHKLDIDISDILGLKDEINNDTEDKS